MAGGDEVESTYRRTRPLLAKPRKQRPTLTGAVARVNGARESLLGLRLVLFRPNACNSLRRLAKPPHFCDRGGPVPRRLGMNSSTTDKIKGSAKEASGKVKEVAGNMTNDPELQDRGTTEKVEGKIQKKVGDVKKVFGK
jgi:uncharacterized protein YjbJ (UPF0337 family)